MLKPSGPIPGMDAAVLLSGEEECMGSSSGPTGVLLMYSLPTQGQHSHAHQCPHAHIYIYLYKSGGQKTSAGSIWLVF